MRNSFFSRLLAVCTLGVLVVILCGCASSPPSKFYQLSATSGPAAGTRSPNQDAMVVVIGPLRIPDYLDRPQIVIRSGKNELRLSEFDRWAGSLDSDIVRVLVENVSAELPQDRFFVIGWTPLLQTRLPAAYKVELIIGRFDGTSDDMVFLSAQWGIFSPEKGLLLKRESHISEEVKGKGSGAIVDAMSRAIGRLSREIADGIVSKAAT